jgi:hypothetical protein
MDLVSWVVARSGLARKFRRLPGKDHVKDSVPKTSDVLERKEASGAAFIPTSRL